MCLLRATRRGFTLIELLIVVAIIAILAAIAVPNFLEAQTRSKVSRVKSDQRSIATAIESYAVDNNKLPYDRQRYVWLGNSLVNSAMLTLTTPISYITSYPPDVFRTDQNFALWAGILNPGEKPGGELRLGYLYGSDNNNYALPPLTRPYAIAAFGDGTIRWELISVGPAGKWGTAYADAYGGIGGNNSSSTYDPTNGTMSFGKIIRCNKGIVQ